MMLIHEEQYKEPKSLVVSMWIVGIIMWMIVVGFGLAGIVTALRRAIYGHN
jgi:hypothetical protein